MEKRPNWAEAANRARELVEGYGLQEEYRLVQAAHGRHLNSGDRGDLEEYQAALHNLLAEIAVRARNEGRQQRP